jgi:serine/threonine-protein phosphatase 2A regulatory subunit B''
VKDEIFDMVKPQDELRITFNDLVRSNVGHTVVSMLIDVNGFYAYDQRESYYQDVHDEEEN